jgi:hypothetical protein
VCAKRIPKEKKKNGEFNSLIMQYKQNIRRRLKAIDLAPMTKTISADSQA